MSSGAPVFPIFLRLEGRPVLLVGGGRVATTKLEGLLNGGAQVTVVAPEIRSDLEQEGVTLVKREFQASDLDGMWFAVAAATHPVNRQVADAAEERRIFVNAVDDPASASAYAGGVFRRGSMTVAISTNGDAPALAGLLREGLETLVPEEIETWLELSRAQARLWRESGIPMEKRRPLLLEALNSLYAGRTQ